MSEFDNDFRLDYMTVQDLHQPPLPSRAITLTWAGLLPFIGALVALVAWPASAALALKAFIGYSAIILSFLGGVRWGRVMAAGAGAPGYVLAVLPSLWAFPALFLPPLFAIPSLAFGFALALWFDTRADTVPATPGFRTLRIRISAAVIACHVGLMTALHLGFGPSP
jgi:hypothetical protein